MRVATWNVNSIRARLDRVVGWLERSDVDVLAFQETKIPDETFPVAPFERLGYQVAHHGFSQWNGVAVASRVGLDDVRVGFADMPVFETLNPAPRKAEPTPGLFDPSGTLKETPAEARAIGATCGGVEVWSLYIPNGRAIGDPHFYYKLDWLAALRAAALDRITADPAAQVLLCGDFNIAPTDEDVWSVEYYEGRTHTTPQERQAFHALIDAGFTDVARPHTPGPGVYTYWDYTQLAFQKRRGMRIDFALGSPALAARVTGARIDRQERKGTGASDHAPVVVELAAT